MQNLKKQNKTTVCQIILLTVQLCIHFVKSLINANKLDYIYWVFKQTAIFNWKNCEIFDHTLIFKVYLYFWLDFCLSSEAAARWDPCHTTPAALHLSLFSSVTCRKAGRSSHRPLGFVHLCLSPTEPASATSGLPRSCWQLTCPPASSTSKAVRTSAVYFKHLTEILEPSAIYISN